MLGISGRERCTTPYIPYTYTHMLQYKIDSDVRLDGRPCYVQEVRELPEETAHDEAPQHTARVRHDNITQAWTANGSVDVGYIGAGRAARGSPEVHRALGRAKASHTQTVSGCVAPAMERGTAGHAYMHICRHCAFSCTHTEPGRGCGLSVSVAAEEV